MSYGGPLLTDMELRYPFAPSSRRFFESVSVEEGLASKEVITQAESRLLSALGRAKYEPEMAKHVEFSSFFAAALVASQDPVLTSMFGKKEAERAKEHFFRERADGKVAALLECFGANVSLDRDGRGRWRFSIPFEGFLLMSAKYDLGKAAEWKLARQALTGGTVHLTDNMVNDLFALCAQAAIGEGVKNLRKGVLPKQLTGVKASVMQYVPVQRPRTGKGYLYVEDLLKHPVSDGRHRLVWLVLAPYLVNVKKVEDGDAIDRIRAFVAAAGETSAMRRFVEYNVRRARRNGLLPPTFAKLKAEHPDIYSLLPKEVVAAEASGRPVLPRASA